MTEDEPEHAATVTISEPVIDSNTEELFLQCVENNDVDRVKLLLQSHNVEVDCPNDNGETALIIASRLGFEELVEYFCEQNADVNATDDDEWSALINASKEGHVKIVEILLDNGAALEHAELGGWTALSWAAYKNRLSVVRLLLERGANSNIVDEHGVSGLIWAAGRGYTEVVQALIASGANINATDKFGNTALVWSARKGFTDIFRMLLNAGSNVDIVGTNSWSPLLLATKRNHKDIVDLTIQQGANVNVVDKDGCSALAVASREGFSGIVDLLLTAGAYINLVDKKGDSVLCSAVRSGHLDIVKALVNKYADVNMKDLSGRTPLYVAVDKGFADIVAALLQCRPDTELKSKDGDTPLLRAVRNRNALIVQMLVKHGAKVSATDKAKDNCLHIALRARSRRLAQILLSKPRDSRLLYRPNIAGETPYSIDQSYAHPILPHIFGPMESHADSEAMLGYDLYSTVLADIVSEPTLSMPLIVGLYAKWGSGKSFLLNKLKDSMTLFMRSWLDMIEFKFDWTVVFVISTALAVLSPAVHAAFDWITAAVFFVLVCFVLVCLYGCVCFGSRNRHWHWTFKISQNLSQNFARLKLLLSLVFYHPPTLREKDLLACPIMFLFADYQRLSSIGGEQALARILLTLGDAVEQNYGRLTTRLHAAFRPSYSSSNIKTPRRFCGVPFAIPTAVIFLVCLAAVHLIIFLSGESMGSAQQQDWRRPASGSRNSSSHSLSPTHSESKDAMLITAATVLIVCLLFYLYPLLLVVIHASFNFSRFRIRRAVTKVDQLKFEGFMELLQREVDHLVDTVRCLDSFTGSQTRLIVFVDGLDSCEQERMLLVLDAMQLLFQKRTTPFVVILAIDPHLVIKAVHHSLHSVFKESEISGHDYLRNMVQLPFYLQNNVIQKLHDRLRRRSDSAELERYRQKLMRQDTTVGGSYLSLAESTKGGSFRMEKSFKVSQGTLFGGATGIDSRQLDFSARIIRDDYFSNINPRSMKRIINTLNLTGRLMRSFEIEFNWLTLGLWISLIEQWPYRMAWLVDFCEDGSFDENTPIKEVYDTIKQYIPTFRGADPMIEMDRNPKNCEFQLASARGETLTVHHVQQFIPFTANLDPYMRKLIKEKRSQETLARHQHQQQHPLPFDSNFPSLTPSFQQHTGPDLLQTRSPRPENAGNATFNLSSGLGQHSDLLLPTLNDSPRVLAILQASPIFNNEQFLNVRLSKLTPDEVCALLQHLNFSDKNYQEYCERIRSCNLSGLVLCVCELDTLKQECNMNFGDWELFKLWLSVFREREFTAANFSNFTPRFGKEQRPLDYYYRPEPPEIALDSTSTVTYRSSGDRTAGASSSTAYRSYTLNTVDSSPQSFSRQTNSGNSKKYLKRGDKRRTTHRSGQRISESDPITEEQADIVDASQDWLQQRLGHLDSAEFAGDRYLSETTPAVSIRSSIHEDENELSTEARSRHASHNNNFDNESTSAEVFLSQSPNTERRHDQLSSDDSLASVCGSNEDLSKPVFDHKASKVKDPQHSAVSGFVNWKAALPHWEEPLCTSVNSSRRPSLLQGRSQVLQVALDDELSPNAKLLQDKTEQQALDLEEELANLTNDIRDTTTSRATIGKTHAANNSTKDNNIIDGNNQRSRSGSKVLQKMRSLVETGGGRRLSTSSVESGGGGGAGNNGRHVSARFIAANTSQNKLRKNDSIETQEDDKEGENSPVESHQLTVKQQPTAVNKRPTVFAVSVAKEDELSSTGLPTNVIAETDKNPIFPVEVDRKPIFTVEIDSSPRDFSRENSDKDALLRATSPV